MEHKYISQNITGDTFKTPKILLRLENRKSSLPLFKKKKVTVTNQPTMIVKGHATSSMYNNISYLDPPLLSDYDFITELLQAKTAKYDKSDENKHFTFIKDSLTLISPKLNVIKEEEISSQPTIDRNKTNEIQNNKSMISIDEYKLSEEYLDAESCTCPSSHCKFLSKAKLENVPELLLSCDISDETLSEKTLKLDSLNNKHKDVFDSKEDFLEKLLNMTDTFVPPETRYSDCILGNSTKYLSGIHYNGIDVSAVSRSQQTVEIEKNELRTKTPKKVSIKLNKNISKTKNISKANQTPERIQKQSKGLIVPASKLNVAVKKQSVTNRGDFSNVNKIKTDNKLKVGYRQNKENNAYNYNKKSIPDVSNRCYVYSPRLNVSKWSNASNAPTFTKKREFALANTVTEYPKEKESNSYIYLDINKENVTNISKNINIRDTYKNQTKKLFMGTKQNKNEVFVSRMGLSLKKKEKPLMCNFEIGAKPCITDETTEPDIKIVLKKIESKNDLNFKSNSCTDESLTDVSESKISHSKVFATDCRLFFNNAYEVFKEHKRSETVIEYNDNKDCSSSIDECSNLILKRSSDKIQTKSCSSVQTTNFLTNKEDEVYLKKSKSPVPSTSYFQRKEHNIISSEYRQSDIVTIYSKTSEEDIKSVGSKSVHCKSITKTDSVDKKLLFNCGTDYHGQIKSCTYRLKTIHSVPQIAKRRQNETKVTKDAIVNTLITMKRNKDLLKLNTSLDKMNKNNNEIPFGNVTENIENMLKYCMKSKGSNVEMNSLSAGSSFTLYATRKKDSTITNTEPTENKYPSSELILRQCSSEQFIRKISNTSHIHNQSQPFENEKPLEIELTRVNEECCTSLFENKTNYGAFTTNSTAPLSDVDSIGTFSSKRLTPFESPKFCKKYSIFSTTEGIIQRIKKLPFMGYECEWQRCTNDMWQFKLLNGRLFLILRLECREESQNKVESERRIVSIGIHKYVIHRKRNNLSAYCVKFVGDSIRFYIATKKWDRIGQVPRLLAKCCSIVRLGAKWEKDMRDAKIRLDYELDNNGLLTMQVANNTLNTLFYISMRVELQKDSYKAWAWPEVKDIRFRQVAGDRPFARNELIAKLRQINLDWDHVTNTLWTINDYLRHNIQGTLSKLRFYRCPNQTPIRKLHNVADSHTIVYQPSARSPCPFTPLFIH